MLAVAGNLVAASNRRDDHCGHRASCLFFKKIFFPPLRTTPAFIPRAASSDVGQQSRYAGFDGPARVRWHAGQIERKDPARYRHG